MPLHYEKVQAKIGFAKEKTDMYVGKRRLADPFTLKRLAKEISHVTGQPQASAEITLTYMVKAVEDAIADGRSVDLGIGTLSPTISTKAAAEADDVKVVKKRVLFRASKELRTIVENMSIKLISDTGDDEEETDSPDQPSGGGEGGGQTPGQGGTTGGDNGGGDEGLNE